MPSTYKTPGVYVEEITKFPPSVAGVETAIPAFIGYTRIAEKNGESLTNKPTRIASFLEFEQFFGGPPARDVVVRLNAAGQYVSTQQKGTPYLLYDSIRLYYDNGGGICYIVSVGDFSASPVIGDATKGILGGLKALEKYDEPTLLLCPDAVNLSTDLYTFQVQAINQCNKLQDRFLICDLLKSDEKTAGQTHDDRVLNFRDNIGINHLKYAAAYTPWIRTSLAAGLRFRDVTFALENEVSPTPATSLALLTSITTNPALLQLLYDTSNAVNAVNALKKNLIPGTAGGFIDAGISDGDAQTKKLLKDYMVVYNDPAKIAYADFTATTQAIFVRIRDIVRAVKVINDALPAVVAAIASPTAAQSVEFRLKSDIAKLNNQVKDIISNIVTHHREIVQKSTTPGPVLNILNTADVKFTDILVFAGFANLAAVPNHADVQAQYRIFTVKKAVLTIVKDIANLPANTTAAAALAAVTAAIPLPADLKIKTDTEITAAKVGAANPAAVITNLTNKLALPATTDPDKVILTVAKTYADEENKLDVPTTVADLVPDPPGFPDVVATAINQALLEARQKAAAAAAVPGAQKADVVNALNFNPVEPKEYTLIASRALSTAALPAFNYYNSIVNAAGTYEVVFDQSLQQSFGLYKTFIAKAGQELMILPPGGAVAGVYASVDANRGVWKAPANASLASVLGPLVLLNAQDQESLNVDANAGKSINAIRAFTGKGTLVWGTRTLAGNDNEWRYVPVRRFFNYAEESIKKSTEGFVFEPNDINTWIRVKAMIENFLTLEWRRGALAGAKPVDAFYVKIGLGETMTSLDIIEGRMIVEIGMAVVRPAEFIVLRFAHKMQES